MRLKSIKYILNCYTCKRYAPGSLPIADGCPGANILILTQDPSEQAQTYMNKQPGPRFIYDPNKNKFANRISNYLLNQEQENYDPRSATYIDGFTVKNFTWLHTANVHVGNSISKLKKPGIHMREKHLPAVIKEMLENHKKGILLIVFGGPAAKSVQNDWDKKLKDFIEDGIDVDYLDKRVEIMVGYHPGKNAWDTMKKEMKPIAQKRVQEIRKKVKEYLSHKNQGTNTPPT